MVTIEDKLNYLYIQNEKIKFELEILKVKFEWFMFMSEQQVEKPMTKRPGELMPSADFNNKVAELKELLGRAPSLDETLSSFLYAKVFQDCKLLAFTYSDDMISYLLLTQFLFYKKIRC